MGRVIRAVLWTMLIASAPALAQTPVVGREYQELSTPQPVSTGEQIEVREFFYYGCPVCYEAQPHIQKWLMRAGPGIALLRIPSVFSESSESFARTFYTLGAMNQLARLHWPLYDNHHFDGKQLNEEKNVVEWVAGNGVDAKEFSERWHSPEVSAQVEAAKESLARYEVKGVPTFVVDGKYLTSARLAGSTAGMMKVVEYLISKAAAERKK